MLFFGEIDLYKKMINIWKSSVPFRVVFGIVLALLSIISVCVGGWFLLVMSLFLISIGANEYKQFMLNVGFAPFFYIITFISFLILVVTIYKSIYLMPLVIFVGVFLSFLAILVSKRKPYIANITTTILGFLICWLPCHLILLSQLDDDVYNISGKEINSGIVYILILFLAVAATDFAAYAVGSRFGKKKLLEEISPNKTVLGSVSGAFCAVIVTVFAGHSVGLNVANSVLLGFLITIFAQIGDLSLSVLKREANLKHSGNLFLKYGGILDRLDSFMFSAPMVYYYFKYNHLFDFYSLIQKVINF